jgi:integrase/recombinase XerD
VVTVVGKGAKPRSVRISKGTRDELDAIRHSASDDAYVFSGRGGQAISVCTAWRIVRRCARRAGLLLAVSPHWMRHANASHALQRGADVAIVRDTLGHSSLSVTSRYVHARPGRSTSDYLAL